MSTYFSELVPPFAHSLALLTHLLASHWSLRSRALLRYAALIRSLAPSFMRELMGKRSMSVNQMREFHEVSWSALSPRFCAGFLDAPSHLYKGVCPSLRLSLRLPVQPSNHRSVTPIQKCTLSASNGQHWLVLFPFVDVLWPSVDIGCFLKRLSINDARCAKKWRWPSR